ncbi:MAG TPA: universal stress protein [Bacteroidales bacterium]|nr:universal stress protein [Bacteroidales bacterium]
MESKRKLIIVPSDFTDVIEFAIDHAANICKMQDAKLMLLHIINKDTKALLKKEKTDLSEIKNRLEKKAIEIAKKYEISVDSMAEEGSIFSTIGQVTKEMQASMIVMGTHGKNGMQHITGSYALKVIETSPAPVIVVQKRGFRKGYNKIVLPVDDTIESKQKVKWAIHIARKYNSTVHLLGMSLSDSMRMAKIKANMLQIIKFFKQNEIVHEYDYAEKNGSFHKQILVYSKSIDADLILIMTEPYKLMPSFMINKWEEQLLFNDSLIPIMAINPIELGIVVGGM